MSRFTTMIKYLREANYDFGLDGEGSYPIFDETYRAALNKKILDHYNFREIGFETAGLFKYYLKTTMNEIMPLYNQMYKSELLVFNPLYNAKLTETYNKTNTIDSSGTSNSNSNSNSSGTAGATGKDVFNDTPQGAITATNIDDLTFATNATVTKNDNVSASESEITDVSGSTSNISNLEDYTKIVEGNNGSQSNSNLLIDFRKTFLNIDMQVINNLNDLFMGLWE